MTNSPVDTLLIPHIKSIQCPTDRTIEYLEELALLLLQTQHLRTEHRGEREGAGCRDGHDDTHHPTQLLEEHTRHTRHHRQWEEHSNHRQRRSNHGDSHLIRCMDSRLFRV